MKLTDVKGPKDSKDNNRNDNCRINGSDTSSSKRYKGGSSRNN